MGVRWSSSRIVNRNAVFNGDFSLGRRYLFFVNTTLKTFSFLTPNYSNSTTQLICGQQFLNGCNHNDGRISGKSCSAREVLAIVNMKVCTRFHILCIFRFSVYTPCKYFYLKYVTVIVGCHEWKILRKGVVNDHEVVLLALDRLLNGSGRWWGCACGFFACTFLIIVRYRRSFIWITWLMTWWPDWWHDWCHLIDATWLMPWPDWCH